MTRLSKIFLLIMVAQFLNAASAFAFVKLSSYVRSYFSQDNAVMNKLIEAEEITNQAATEYMRMKGLAQNGELGNYAVSYGFSKGKQLAAPQLEKYKEKLKKTKLYEKTIQKRDALIAKKNDYVESVKKAQQKKREQIEKRLTELKAKVQSKVNKDDQDKTMEEIASLEEQAQQNSDKPIEQDENYKELQKQEKELNEQVLALKQEIGDSQEAQELAVKNMDLFNDEENDENKSIYQTEIDSLFLKENEETTSENIARIKKNRGREYYYAVQNAMQVAVVGEASSKEIEQKVVDYMDMSKNVEGNLSVKNINVGVIIESAKAAAHYTQALLADIRLKTIKDMNAWNNKYHLYDYTKPVTEFDFDSYELKKTDLKTKAKNFYDKNKGQVQDYYNSHKDDIKNMWHKM